MVERGDWEADSEGNLTPPSDLVPDTDEFGREDPAALERERRRRERELRRRGQKPKREKSSGAVTGSFGKLLGGRKERGSRRREKPGDAPTAPAPEQRTAPASTEQPVAPSPDPTQEATAPRAGRAAAGARAMGERATAGRDALRRRVSRREQGQKPPRTPAAAGPAGNGRGNYRRRRVLALALALFGILAAWLLVALFQPFAGDGEGEGTVTVEVPEGSDAGDIANLLDDAGVITSGRLFEWRLRLAGKADDVQADTYTLAEGMSYGAAIERLTGETTGGLITLTIPEGLDRNQIAADVLPEGVSSEEYLQLTERPPQGSKFNPAQYGAKSTSLEGFLFPATYDLQEGQGSRELVDLQLRAFQDNIAGVDLGYAKKKNLTVYDVLIIASMIDKEVQVAKERPLVAAVIYNRLSKGIPLGIDATTRYETQNYTEPITQDQLAANTPYNTRLNAGLTPTPIGNPGLDAIKAAAAPARENYLYFVVKPGTCGEHSFTASEQEFERLAAEYQQALEAEGGSPTTCPE